MGTVTPKCSRNRRPPESSQPPTGRPGVEARLSKGSILRERGLAALWKLQEKVIVLLPLQFPNHP